MESLDLLDEFPRLVRRLRAGMRFGTLSRRSLQILRVELVPPSRLAGCDWLIRPVDAWDEALPQAARARVQSQQVLHDALRMRSLIFRRFPEIRAIELRAFRVNQDGEHELVLAGTVQRGDEVPESVPSLAMRAHLSGFQFLQVDGVLSPLPYEGLRYSHRS